MKNNAVAVSIGLIASFVLLLALAGMWASGPTSVLASVHSTQGHPATQAQPAHKAPQLPACGPDWVVVNSPNVGTGNLNYLNGVATVSSTDVWAVGYYGNLVQPYRTLVEHWDGSAWSIISSPNAGTGNNYLNGVAKVSGNDVWAVGYYYNSSGSANQTLVEHWDGSAWSIVPSPNVGTFNNYLNGVAVVSGNDVWAVGYRNSLPYPLTLVEHWDGSAWSVISSPNPALGGNLYGVAAVSSTDVWAVGYFRFTQVPEVYYTLAEHWNGSVWSWVSTSNSYGSYLYGVAAVSSTDVWAAGYYVGAPDQTLVEHSSGGAWSIVSSPNAGTGNNYLYGVGVASANDVWAVGYYHSSNLDQTLAEHWDGGAWNVIYSPNVGTGNNHLNGIGVASGNDVWAVGYYADGGGLSQTLVERYNPCTPTATSTNTPTRTNTATNTTVPTNTPTRTNTATYTPTPTNTPTIAPTNTPTRTNTPANTPTRTPTNTPTSSPTNTPTNAPSTTNTPQPTATPTNTSTRTPTSTFTNTPTPTPTNTPTALPTQTPGGASATPIPSDTPTNTPSITPTNTRTSTGTSTGTSTPTDLPTHNPTAPTNTPTYMPGATNTPQPSDTPINPLATSTSCPIQFTDVPQDSAFYPYIRCMACRGLVNGYSSGCESGDPCFRPNYNVTRGQLAKIVSNAAGFSDPQTTQLFEDVPVAATFFPYIGRLASRGYIGGYPCGGAGEPCIPPSNRPYFRANANATRGQITKIDSNAAGFSDAPVGQQFEDIQAGSTFYTYTYRLVTRGIMTGYPCGGTGEPCLPGSLPYFRPNNNATRGQTSKIVANTFNQGCSTPLLP